MPRIPVHTVDSAPEESRVELKSLQEKFGKVLNIHGGMAHSPVVLQSYIALQQASRTMAPLTPEPARPLPWWWATWTSAPTASQRTPSRRRPPA
jgi:hypothetical protein